MFEVAVHNFSAGRCLFKVNIGDIKQFEIFLKSSTILERCGLLFYRFWPHLFGFKLEDCIHHCFLLLGCPTANFEPLSRGQPQ